jgi:tetratricopeptide (TPR) repeat protein
MLKALTCIALLALGVAAAAVEEPPKMFLEAQDLVHAYTGSGDELDRAMEVAEQLSRSHPNAGYAQALRAEALSTWRLEQDGGPPRVLREVLSLANEALRLDPNLPLAHVALARALVRSSQYKDAETHIARALELDPGLAGAMFLRAEIYRRTNQVDSAESWYLKFVQATRSGSRKSNGYYWIGKMYQDLAWDRPAERQALTAKARQAYEQMLAIESSGAWRNVNFAIFLNGFAADFNAAERYASIALREMEFPMARYHLAAARYQRLWMRSGISRRADLAASIEEVAASTRVTLEDAIAFSGFSSVVVERLVQLRSKAANE